MRGSGRKDTKMAMARCLMLKITEFTQDSSRMANSMGLASLKSPKPNSTKAPSCATSRMDSAYKNSRTATSTKANTKMANSTAKDGTHGRTGTFMKANL